MYQRSSQFPFHQKWNWYWAFEVPPVLTVSLPQKSVSGIQVLGMVRREAAGRPSSPLCFPRRFRRCAHGPDGHRGFNHLASASRREVTACSAQRRFRTQFPSYLAGRDLKECLNKIFAKRGCSCNTTQRGTFFALSHCLGTRYPRHKDVHVLTHALCVWVLVES